MKLKTAPKPNSINIFDPISISKAVAFCLFVFFLILLIISPLLTRVRAQVKSPENQVTASVGEFDLNLSGYITAFASIVMSSDNTFVRATVSDEKGNFIIPQVLIKKGFDNFCLDAIDFKRLGESYTCFKIPPAESSVTKDNIFLPPTLGLEKDTIPESGFTYAYGYTMPNALVTLHFSNDRELSVNADSIGFYTFLIKDLKAGEYTLFATAEYNSKQSLNPDKKVKLRSLSKPEQILEELKKLSKEINKTVQKNLTSVSFGPLWFIFFILILILIITLIIKIWPEKFRFIIENKPDHPLHHLWWMGY